MVVFPNCKINLGLHIRRKRADNYHDLETIFYPIMQRDMVEVLPSKSGKFSFQQDGLKIEGNPENNLTVKAYHLLKQDFPNLPAINMFLYKTIPAGAGLGGGSADGAFTLHLLNDLFRLAISKEKLSEYALQLGSDCPFFLVNKPAFAQGRGEKLRPIDITLAGLHILIVNPKIHISTGEAFQKLKLKDEESHFEKIAEQPIEKWKDILYNDFEEVIFPLYPEIRIIKEQLYQNGALFAAMSGTGSTCFGIFKQLPNLDFLPKQYFCVHFPL